MHHMKLKWSLALLLALLLTLSLFTGCRQSEEEAAEETVTQTEETTVQTDPEPQDQPTQAETEPLPHESEETEEPGAAEETTDPEIAEEMPAEPDATDDDAGTGDSSTPEVQAQPSAMTQLQQALQGMVSSYGGSWSVYVKRLDTGESFAINDGPMVAASLIKLWVYGATGQAEQNGTVAAGSYDSTLSAMITVSDNASCNLLIDVLGKGTINSFIQNQGYWNTSLNRKMLSGEPVENYTSVSDCGRLLEQVYYGTFVSADTSASLLTDLQNQTRRWKIPAGLPSGIRSANKTGELADVENDVAIVYGPSCTYILCVMSDNVAPGTAQANIQSISSTVYYALNG